MSKALEALWPLQARAAIFDFDGTLADTAGIWHKVDIAFLSQRNLEYTEEYPRRLSALGFVDGARYTIDKYGLSESVEEICDEWNRMGRELYRDSVALRQGAVRYITALRDCGIPCALATTNDPEVLGSMRHADVNELFDACVYGVEVGKGKDHPDIYVEAANRLGVDCEECLVFEDIVPAVLSARRVGMTTCGVRANDPSQDVDKMRSVADMWLEDWQDVPLGDTPHRVHRE